MGYRCSPCEKRLTYFWFEAIKLPDWQAYFNHQKVALDERLLKLQDVWKRINL